MAIKIKFDAAYNPEPPTIILAKKSGHKLGILNAKSIEVRDAMNDVSEISFTVHKEDNGEICYLWKEVKDFRLVFCPEWNKWFEIVVELNESDDSIKTVTGTELGAAELSQIMLYNIQINTEADIARDEYDEEDPTIFYNPDNTDASLLHRITEKAPHYSIRHVDDSIASTQTGIEFEFDDTSIYDAFQEISEKIGCIFVLHSDSDADGNILREFSVYDLKSNCNDCGHRGEFTMVCPKCASTNIDEGYGDDTTIFVTSDEIAEEIQLSSETDEIKNCFKLEAGDGNMNAAIKNCNPNGTDYIWHISDEVKSEMSEELAELIDSYDKLHAYYQDEYTLPLDDEVILEYNKLIEKYQELDSEYDLPDFDVNKIGSEEVSLKGYPALMSYYYDTIELLLFLESSLMPSIETEETDARQEANVLETEFDKIAIPNINIASISTINTYIIEMAKVIVDPRYNVEIYENEDEGYEPTLTEASDDEKIKKIWTGKLVVTHSAYDEEDYEEDMTDEELEAYVITTKELSIEIVNAGDDYETFMKQKIEKALNEDDVEDMSISGLFKKDLTVEESVVDGEVIRTFSGEFYDELKKYCIKRLESFLVSCRACIEMLEGSDSSEWINEETYDEFSSPYYDKEEALVAEIAVRDVELDLVEETQNIIERIRSSINNKLNFENYIINLGNIEEVNPDDEEIIPDDEENTESDYDEEVNPDEYENINPDEYEYVVEPDDSEDEDIDTLSDGEKLWIEFCSYRREDKYSNENYVSVGLNDVKLFERALEFIEVARDELYKSAELQHTISTTLRNLLVIKKFESLVNSFATGNWLRVMIDDEVFKLRLTEYSIDYDDLDNISVDFSDVTKNLSVEKKIADVLSKASSMATSYSYVQQAMSKNAETIDNTINNWLETGLDTTNIKIVNGADNQTQIWDESGMLFREYNSLTGDYEPTQLRIINSTIAITDDNWDTLKMAIGNMYYTDPLTGETKESYGVNAETIVGKLFVGENLILSNDSGTMTFDDNGLIVKGIVGDGEVPNRVVVSPNQASSLSVQTQDGNDWNNVLSVDEKGNLVVVGNITAHSLNLLNQDEVSINGELTGFADVAFSGRFSDLDDDKNIDSRIIDLESGIGSKFDSPENNGSSGQYLSWDSFGSVWRSATTTIEQSGNTPVSGSAVYNYVNNYALNKTQTDNAGKFMYVDNDGNISFATIDEFKALLGI